MGSSNSKDSFETPMREEVMDDSRSRGKANSDGKKSPVKSEFVPEENSKDSAEMPNKEDAKIDSVSKEKTIIDFFLEFPLTLWLILK